MIDIVETASDIGLYDVRKSSKLQLAGQIPHSILRTCPRSVAVTYIQKILFIDGFQNLGHCKLQYHVIRGRNPQWSQFPH